MVQNIKTRVKKYNNSTVARQYDISVERVRQIKAGDKLKNCK